MERVKLVFIKIQNNDDFEGCDYTNGVKSFRKYLIDKNIDFVDCDISYRRELTDTECEKILETFNDNKISCVNYNEIANEGSIYTETKGGNKNEYKIYKTSPVDFSKVDYYKDDKRSEIREASLNSSNETSLNESEMFEEPLSLKSETHEVLLSQSETSIYSVDTENNTENNERVEKKLDKLINLVEEKITTKTSYELGKVGETSVEDLLKQTFPKLEIQNVASIPHQGDVQMRDDKNDILFMFEIKNKQQINLADINKFKDDVKTLEKSNLHVVGIFISLVSNIPIYGEFNINNNLTYITNKYMNSECLKVIVDSYIYLLKQKLKIETNVQYTIPENVYTLLAKINSEYNDLNNELDILQKQVDYNKASTSSMMILIEKINIRKKFINYIKQEFLKLNITDPIEKKKVEEENEIDKFREYLKSISVWRITKKDLLSNFPNLKTLINENKLEVLIREYRN